MDEYLQKSDPEYAKLTNEADKKAYLKSKQEELKQIMSKLYPELKNADMKNYSMKALVLLQASILEGKPLSEYKNYSKEDLEMVMNSTLEKVVLGFVDKNLSGENVSPEEKLHTMLDTMLSVIDPQYASLSDKEKNEKCHKIIDVMLNSLSVQYDPASRDKNLDSIVNFLESMFQDVKDGKKTMLDVLDLFSDPSSMLNDIIDYQKNIIENDPNLSDEEKARLINDRNNVLAFNKSLEVISGELGKPKSELSMNDCLKWLEGKKVNGELPKEYKFLADTLKDISGVYPDLSDKPNAVAIIRQAINSTSSWRASEAGCTVAELISNDAAQFKKLGFNNPELIEYMKKNYSADPTGLKLLRVELNKMGFSDEQITEFYDKHHLSGCSAAVGRNSGEPTQVAAILAVTAYSDDENVRKLGRDTADNIGNYVSEKDLTKFNISAAQDSIVMDTYGNRLATAMNNWYSAEVVMDAAKAVANSNEVSDGVKATYSKNLVETASPERQAYYGRELSKTGNEAVIEGLAAATNSVDPGVRSQYTSYVSEAASRCSAEAQARINTAMETGEISAYTKNSTTTTNNTSSNVENSRTYETVQTSAKDSTNPQVRTVNYDAATAALEQKRDILGAKILETSTNISASVAAHEAGVSQTVVDEVEEILVAMEDGTSDDSMAFQLRKIIESENIEALYSKLVAIKGSTIIKAFISAIVNYADAEQIVSFANSFKDDSSLMEELFSKAGPNLRLKLIKTGVISESLIYKMIANGTLTDFDGIDGKLIYKYVLEHLNDIGINGLGKYWRYIPWEKQQELLAKFNEMRGVTTPATVEDEQDGRTEANEEPQHVAQISTTEASESLQDSQTTEATQVRAMEANKKKDKLDTTPVSMNPELEPEDDMFANPLLSKRETEGDNPNGKKTKDQITRETGLTRIQQQRDAGLIPGSDAWAKMDKQAPNYIPPDTKKNNEDDDFSGVIGGTQYPTLYKMKKNINFNS